MSLYRSRAFAAVAALLTTLTASLDAGAQESSTSTRGPVTRPVELRHDLAADGIATGTMAAAMITWGFVLKPAGTFGSSSCTWCDGPGTRTNSVDAAFRDAFKADDTGTPATVSHVLSYGVSPAAGIALTAGVAAHDRRANEAPLNMLLAVEASLAAVLAKEALSLGIRRERPAVHALEGQAKVDAMAKGDPLESFPSGHLASELAIMTAVGTIATMRGYRLAPLVWAVGGTLALAIGYLRIAADQHYFTDNLIGAGVGIGVGAAVPLLFHRPVGTRGPVATRWLEGAVLSSRTVQGGRTVSLGWAF